MKARIEISHEQWARCPIAGSRTSRTKACSGGFDAMYAPSASAAWSDKRFLMIPRVWRGSLPLSALRMVSIPLSSPPALLCTSS